MKQKNCMQNTYRISQAFLCENNTAGLNYFKNNK